MDAHWWWLTAAIVLAIAELVVPGAFLIWIATAAALTGVAALLIGVPLAGQFVLFALLSVASVYLGRRIYGEAVPSGDPMLNDRAARLIGETLVVVEATSLIGTLGGIGELAREALGGGGTPEARKAPPTVPQVRRGPFEGK